MPRLKGQRTKPPPPCPECGMPRIESDVPISAKLGVGGVVLTILMKLKVGDSFYLDLGGKRDLIKKHQMSMYTQARRSDMDVITRVDEKGIRIWRKR